MDIVRYQNKLNEYPIFNLTEVEQNIFMALLSKTTFNDDQWISVQLSDLQEKSQYSVNSTIKFSTKVHKLLNKICSQKVYLETEKFIHVFVCFDEQIFDKDTGTLKVHIQNTFFDMLKNYKLGFTSFELAEFVCLTGNYTKSLYRLLKQFRTQGEWTVKKEDFRKLLNVPEKYRLIDIDRNILKPAVEQLSREHDLFDTVRVPFKNLKVDKIKKVRGSRGGRGGTVVAFKFTFDAEEIKKVPEEKKQIHSKENEQENIPVAQKVENEYLAEERH